MNENHSSLESKVGLTEPEFKVIKLIKKQSVEKTLERRIRMKWSEFLK